MQSSLTQLINILTDESHINPINLNEEKETFFASHHYEPQFKYKKPDFSFTTFKRILEQYLQKPQHDDPRISQLIQERIRDLFLWIELIEHRGTTFGETSARLFGLPTKKTLQEAEKLITLPSDRDEKTISAEELRRTLQSALQEERLDWTIELSDSMTARAQVTPAKSLMKINAHELFSERDVKKLIIHEIKTHGVRYRNGLSQPHEVFSAGTSNYLETEEGLAVVMEERNDCLPNTAKRSIGARAIAVQMAKTESFFTIYTHLSHYLPKESAFKLATRAKRGLTDTSLPGGFTKDHLYLSGYLKVKSLSKEDFKNLFVGKIHVNHLPIVKELIAGGKLQSFEVPTWK